jgi:hypothetical protein
MMKGNKVTKGWVSKFVLLKDFKISIYEKERDVDFTEGTALADIR